MDAMVAQMVERQHEVEQAGTLTYWFEQSPDHLSFEHRMLLARAALITFKLMVRVGVH